MKITALHLTLTDIDLQWDYFVKYDHARNHEHYSLQKPHPFQYIHQTEKVAAVCFIITYRDLQSGSTYFALWNMTMSETMIAYRCHMLLGYEHINSAVCYGLAKEMVPMKTNS